MSINHLIPTGHYPFILRIWDFFLKGSVFELKRIFRIKKELVYKILINVNNRREGTGVTVHEVKDLN